MDNELTKPDVARLVSLKLKDKGIRKKINIPASKFTITDEEGNSSVFRVRKTNRTEAYTIKDASAIIDAMWEVIEDALSDNKTVSFFGYGSFELRQTEARKVKHPLTREWLDVESGHRVAFSPGSRMKQAGRDYDMQLKDELEAAELNRKIINGEL